MNTREENGAAALREAQEIQHQQQLRHADLQWARRWHDQRARYPRCAGTAFNLMDTDADGGARQETFQCEAPTCQALWTVKFREAAWVVRREDSEDEWIESPLLSERETATVLAALRYWRRERLASAGHEGDIETAFDHVQPLSEEEIDALCERIAGLTEWSSRRV